MTTTQRNIVGLLVLVVAFLFAQSAAADVFTVGDGTPQGCTETALKDTLALPAASGGGTVVFACGPDPAAITLTAFEETDGVDGGTYLVLPDQVTIDGGGMITLISQPKYLTATIIVVHQNTSAALNNLSMTSNTVRNVTGVRNEGILNITNCVLFNIDGGGGVINSGVLTVADSTFTGNFGNSGGGAILNIGTATVSHSTLSQNRTGNRGGAIENAGTFVLNNSTVDDNSCGKGGGAISIGNFSYFPSPGFMTINNSSLSRNFGGGAIEVTRGSLTIHNSEITDNEGGGFYAGGITIDGPPVEVLIYNSTITGNRTLVTGGGGGIWNWGAGDFALFHTEVTGNTPTDIVQQ
jgi:hypothetical protein